jgi:hypothetical protein
VIWPWLPDTCSCLHVACTVAFHPAFPSELIFLLSDGPHNDKKGNSIEKSAIPAKMDSKGEHFLRDILPS